MCYKMLDGNKMHCQFRTLNNRSIECKIRARGVAIQKSEPKTIRVQEAVIACDLEI